MFTGLVGIATSTIAFGLSTSFAGIIASRCLGWLSSLISLTFMFKSQRPQVDSSRQTRLSSTRSSPRSQTTPIKTLQCPYTASHGQWAVSLGSSHFFSVIGLHRRHMIRPLVGGTLADAATRYPQYFSWRTFVEHPYLPPCIVSAACALVGAGLGYTLIEEVRA